MHVLLQNKLLMIYLKTSINEYLKYHLDETHMIVFDGSNIRRHSFISWLVIRNCLHRLVIVFNGGVLISLVIMFCVMIVLSQGIIYSLNVFLVRLSGETHFCGVGALIRFRIVIRSSLGFVCLALEVAKA